MDAGQWGTAAIVWAYVEDGTPGPKSENGDLAKSRQISVSDFAKLKIRGLSTRDSVRKYRKRWQDAIDEGLAEPAEPGKKPKCENHS